MHYDPLKDKTPYGAAVAGEPVAFRFALPAAESADKVTVILRRGAEEFRSDLRFARFEGDDIVYEGSVTAPVAGLWYYRFESVSGGRTSYYGRGRGGCAVCGEWLPEWQLTVTKRAYKTPDWTKSGVVYQIFADRFAREGTPDFCKKGRLHADWYDLPDIAEEGQDYRADDFFGGNAEGVISRLDYLAELGVTTLYLSPVFLSSSNHRYDTADYMRADELFGGDEGVKKLCAEAHGRGMRVVLDGVFNHTGADSVYFNKYGTYGEGAGAYRDEKSPYRAWYRFRSWPKDYDCWWGFTTLPNVNEMEKSYRAFINGEDGVAAHWIKAGTSGWRLDVADELPMPFLRELRRRVKATDAEATLLGEVWEDPTNKIAYGEARCYCAGDTLDSVMNYPLREAVLAFFTFRIDAYALVRRIEAMRESMPPSFFYSLMNLLGSHDKPRAINVLADCGNMQPERRYRFPLELTKEQYERGKRRLIAAWTLICALPGMPCIYYGDEAGLTGMADPFCRKTFPWGREDEELTEKMREQSLKRRNSPALRTGDMRIYAESADALVVERFIEHGQDVFGNSAKDERVRVRVDREGL